MSQHTIGSSEPQGGIPRLRPEAIPLLSYGFRPFFLGAALWAFVAMILWIGLLSGSWTFATGYGVIAWHAHEFLFGYIAAVMTGFLLTAIPNWTGRFPLQGKPLLALFLVWLAGRIAMEVDKLKFVFRLSSPDVRFNPKADIAEREEHVRFVPKQTCALSL